MIPSQRARSAAIFLAAAVILNGCASDSAPAQGPGAGPWVVSTPEKHGLSSAALAQADQYISGAAQVRKCLIIIKDGEIVYETGDTQSMTQGFSMTKTLGALVVGVAVREGRLDVTKDITETYGVVSPKSYGVTSEEIMSQKIFGGAPGQNFYYDALGTRWVNTLAQVVRKATGRTSHELWQEELQGPLGLSGQFSWVYGDLWASGAVGSGRDWARIGQLLLNKGAWLDSDGTPKQLVTEEYVSAMTEPHAFNGYPDPNVCYGYLTWLNQGSRSGQCVGADGPYIALPKGAPDDVFLMAGISGEVTMVIPSHNVVVVSLGASPALGTWVAQVIYTAFCNSNVFGDKCGQHADEVVV